METGDGSAVNARFQYGHYLGDDLRLGAGVSAGSSFNPTASYGANLNLAWQTSFLEKLVLEFRVAGGSVDDTAYYEGGLAAVFYFGETHSLRQKIREDW